jgi:hypothetical protein
VAAATAYTTLVVLLIGLASPDPVKRAETVVVEDITSFYAVVWLSAHTFMNAINLTELNHP